MFVDGIPAPQGRPRGAAFCTQCRRYVMVRMYPPKSEKLKAWRARLAEAFGGAGELTDGREVRLEFYLPRPKSGEGARAEWPVNKNSGDPDNLAKPPLDILVASGGLLDDSRIRHLDVWRHYADDRSPGMEITFG